MLFVIDVKREALAVSEANKLGIPVIAVVDSNCAPEGVDYIIPGNDDAARAIQLYCDLAARAALDGMSAQLDAAGVDLGEMEEVSEDALDTHASPEEIAKSDVETKTVEEIVEEEVSVEVADEVAEPKVVDDATEVESDSEPKLEVKKSQSSKDKTEKVSKKVKTSKTNEADKSSKDEKDTKSKTKKLATKKSTEKKAKKEDNK